MLLGYFCLLYARMIPECKSHYTYKLSALGFDSCLRAERCFDNFMLVCGLIIIILGWVAVKGFGMGPSFSLGLRNRI